MRVRMRVGGNAGDAIHEQLLKEAEWCEDARDTDTVRAKPFVTEEFADHPRVIDRNLFRSMNEIDFADRYVKSAELELKTTHVECSEIRFLHFNSFRMETDEEVGAEERIDHGLH